MRISIHIYLWQVLDILDEVDADPVALALPVVHLAWLGRMVRLTPYMTYMTS